MRSYNEKIVPFRGGLDLEGNPLSIDPGRIIACRNFGVKTGGGYYRVKGYERFDGQTAPSQGGTRGDIAAVPGEGDILGVWLYNGVVYAFRNAVGGATAVMYKSTGSGWSSVKTGLSPDGKYEFVNYNFYATSPLTEMYGVDGVNPPFKFDGATYTALTVTGAGATGEPEHICAHKNHLFLSYQDGEWVHSGIGDPSDFNATTGGAGNGGVGSDIVGMRATVGGALAIFSKNRTTMLYGSNQTDWQTPDLRPQAEQTGAEEWTIQPLGSDIVYFDDRGLTSLQQTETYGNFSAATFDESIRRYLQDNKANIITSCISRNRDEYRLFLTHSDGTQVITATFGNGFEGFGRAIYPFTATCACSLEDNNGNERIFVGASDGFVYELDSGNSFDGSDINAYFKLAFNHVGMPQYRKRFRSARFNLDAPADVTISVKPDFDYANPIQVPHRLLTDDIEGNGGLWGEENWNNFSWGTELYPESELDICHSARNMSLLVSYTGSDQDFTLYDCTVIYSPRGFHR